MAKRKQACSWCAGLSPHGFVRWMYFYDTEACMVAHGRNLGEKVSTDKPKNRKRSYAEARS